MIVGVVNHVLAMREFCQDGCQESDFRDGIDCMLEGLGSTREAMEFINVS